ncbi:hypothetical protein XCR1_2410023 [Xenorhabdus cabanillasii JM26]|uniref:Uncharacterized protein n=1 Tax=Xenorhabdus cabanillasii JM26 TaxID=1427517 RepID=W1J7I7_9GAMM|nr:hypothetical protein XCR1_2410023 [Xenorhabdus cabanillasii JM26]
MLFYSIIYQLHFQYKNYKLVIKQFIVIFLGVNVDQEFFPRIHNALSNTLF